MTETTFLVCTHRRLSQQNPSCAAHGSELLIAKLRELGANVQSSCCFGRCGKGVVVRVLPAGKFYCDVTENEIVDIFEQNQAE